MAEDQDQSQKTEEPTRKRLDDARKRGQIVTSREINSLFILFAFALVIVPLMPGMMRNTTYFLMPFLAAPETMRLDDGSSLRLLKDTLAAVAGVIAIPFLLALAAALAAGFMQSRFNFSWDPLAPKLERISPLKGIERLFSMRSLVEFLKGVVKITIVGVVATLAVWPSLPELRLLPDMEIAAMLLFLMKLVTRMMIGVLCAMLFIALLDYLYQHFEFIKSLRMSKQEVKDEYKQQEGDPHIKQKLRSIRMERARKRMMAAVPESDVVITNPTHYAVALKYDMDSMAAPIVLAKGIDDVAQRIRAKAEEHKIPIMRNPPLARALYDNVEVDQAIPYAYYHAVAKIVGYVYKLKGKKMPGEGKAKGRLK